MQGGALVSQIFLGRTTDTADPSRIGPPGRSEKRREKPLDTLHGSCPICSDLHDAKSRPCDAFPSPISRIDEPIVHIKSDNYCQVTYGDFSMIFSSP